MKAWAKVYWFQFKTSFCCELFLLTSPQLKCHHVVNMSWLLKPVKSLAACMQCSGGAGKLVSFVEDWHNFWLCATRPIPPSCAGAAVHTSFQWGANPD